MSALCRWAHEQGAVGVPGCAASAQPRQEEHRVAAKGATGLQDVEPARLGAGPSRGAGRSAGRRGRSRRGLSKILRRKAMSGSQPSGPGRLCRTRVLVVEDEFIVSLALRVQLESMGYQVVGLARDATTALRQVEELRPDVVLMDIGLSGGDGVAATRAIMEQAPTRVIVVTAYGDDRVQAALEAGARLALTKPIVDEQLAEAISEVTADDEG
jgi:CheY-like chemotaxis protein